MEIIVENTHIEVEKKKIKNLYIRIKPPEGRVCISAPLKMKDEDIYRFALSKIDWIEKHGKRFENYHEHRFVSGEKVYLWGKAYVLDVRQGRGMVIVGEGKINLYVDMDKSPEYRREVMEKFYRKQLEEKMSIYVPIWEERTGLYAKQWRIRKMKTRWGTCNTSCKRIWLSLYLAQKPVYCLESVIVHELTHLVIKNHNRAFKDKMEEFYPKWREAKKALSKMEDCTYV